MIEAAQNDTKTETDELDQIYLALIDHDLSAWTAFYEQYQGKLDRFFGKAGVKNREDREDLLQDVMYAIFNSLHRYDPQKSAFKNWVYGVARNVMLNYYNGYLKQYEQETELDENSSYPLFSTLPSSPPHDYSKVEKALERLTENEREIIQLRLGREHISWKELALELNLSVSAAKMRYTRALARMKSLLNEVTTY